MLRAKICCLGWLIYHSIYIAEAQIEEDSTRNQYGPHTIRVFSTSSLLSLDTPRVVTVDTLLRRYDLLSVPEQRTFSYTHLGHIGSATRPLLYDRPYQIGARSGLRVYAPYFLPPEQVALYHTYAPYASAEAILGDDRRNGVALSFTRNFSPSWNMGFDFQRLSIEDQIGPRVRNKLQTRMTSFRLHTHLTTPDSIHTTYLVYSRMNHENFDYGGSLFQLSDPPGLRFAYRSASPALEQAKGTTRQYAIEGLYRLRLRTRAYLYLRGRTWREHFNFYDNLRGLDSTFYRERLLSLEETNEELSFRTYNLSTGFLWRSPRHSLKLSLGQRWIDYEENLSPSLSTPDEHYLSFAIRRSIEAVGALELRSRLLLSGQYTIEGLLRHRNLSTSLWFMRYKPAFLEQAYEGNHHSWHQVLHNPQAAGLDLHLGTQSLPRTDLRYTLSLRGLRHYIYYDTAERPHQLPPLRILGLAHTAIRGTHTFLSDLFVIESSLHFRRFLGEKSPAFAFPSYQSQQSLYYQDGWFEKSTRVQIGLRWRWRSSYYGFAYQPAIQQFYAQDDFLLEAYDVLDIFFKAKVKHFRFLVRIIHLNKSTGESYFTTPYYLGERRFLDFKFSWQFFN